MAITSVRSLKQWGRCVTKAASSWRSFLGELFLLLTSLALLGAIIGCSGLVSGSTASNPPPGVNITSVQAASVTTSVSQIVWTTNVASDSSVDYGTSPSYGFSTPVSSTMVTSHQITLSGLAASTTYYYQVNSTDSSGNHAHSGGHSFKTGSGSTVPPSIATQPAGQTVTAGQTATFTVAATGTAPLSYQWQKNGANITGATSPSYTTPATTTADSGSTFAVVVSNTAGTVTSNAATLTVNAPAIQVNPTTISFGNVVVGTNLSQSLIISNPGTATLTITQVTATSTAFSAGGFTLPLSVNAGQQTTITVAFLPTTVSTVTGSISVVSNTPASPTSVGLSGTGIAATYTLGVSPTSLSFGNVSVGNTSSLSTTLTNTGNSNVTISSMTVTGAGFSASGVTSGTVLTPSQSATLNITFTPVAAGTAIGSASIASNATNSPTTIALSGTGATTTTINVKNYGATGNGSTDDTTAINSAIAALTSGATLLFPCGTYLTTSQLTLNISNITVDGSGCATIHNTSSGTVFAIGSSGNGTPNYGSAVALSATANELATSFATVSSLGVSPGDYVRLQEGGKDSSAGSGDTGCDAIGCRGELLKVAAASGNTITVTTALHDTYNPSVNAATAQKLFGPISGITVKNITFDGNGSNVYGLAIAGVMNSTVSSVTSRNVQGSALLNRGDFNMSWSNITVTGAGSAQCGSSAWFENQGNLSINGLSISNENPGAPGTGCLYNGAFGFELIGSSNNSITSVTVDGAGAYGRPMKLGASRWNTLNSITAKNGVAAMNGLVLHYYSSHNTFNNCVVTNNGAGTGTGTGNAGINSFGNFNQFNTFNNCTVSGNGNIQVLVNSFDALRLAQDSNITINGGTFTGENSIEPPIYIEGANAYIHGVTVNGPGAMGMIFDSNGTNACINNNTFMGGSGLGGAINSTSSTNVGSGNILNGLSSNLTPGTCGPSGVAISISPMSATVASGGTQQFNATVTGSTNTAVTWSATAGSVSSSGLFSAPTVSANTTVTVTVTSQADTSKAASATVTVTPLAPPNTFGYTVQGATVGTSMSNSVSATRYQMASQNATVTSMSVFIASPVSASPNNQFQVAIYSDNNGTPGALLASSASQTIVPDAWNTVLISAPVTANTYYWLAYNTNGLATNTNNLRYDVGGATSTWISSEPFGAWPATFGPVGGTSSYSASIYASFQ